MILDLKFCLGLNKVDRHCWASGDTLRTFTAQSPEPGTATANFALYDTRNGHPVLNFTSGTVVKTQFGEILPRNYAGGGIRVIPHVVAGTATAGTVVIGAAFERIGTGLDIDGDSYGGTLFGTLTMPGTAGVPGTIGIEFTNGAAIDSLAVGEAFRIEFQRAGTFATDTMGGTLQLLAIEMMEI